MENFIKNRKFGQALGPLFGQYYEFWPQIKLG